MGWFRGSKSLARVFGCQLFPEFLNSHSLGSCRVLGGVFAESVWLHRVALVAGNLASHRRCPMHSGTAFAKVPAKIISSFAVAVLLSLVFADTSRAQSDVFTKWIARFDAAHSLDQPVALATDSRGNVYVTGWSCVDVNTCADQEALTIKYDSSGKLIWKAWLSAPSRIAQGLDIGVDSAGNAYVFFNFSHSLASAPSEVVPEVVTAKYNSAGVRQWINFIDSDPQPGGLLRNPSHLAASPLGNVYITYTESESASISRAITTKYDTTGKTVWSQAVNDAAGNFPFAVGLDAHENIYVDLGVSNNNIDFDEGEIVKYDPNGIRLATFGRGQMGDLNAFHVDSAGACYFLGRGEPVGAPNVPDQVVAKFNPDQSRAFLVDLTKTAPDPSRGLAAISSDSTGDTFVAQTISGASTATHGTDISVIKFDATGHEKFLTRYNGHTDDSGNDGAVALAVNSTGDVYVTGASERVVGVPEFATIKYNVSGVQQWVERYAGSAETYDSPRAIAISGGSVIVTGASNGIATSTDWTTIDYVQDAAVLTPSALAFGNQPLKVQSAKKFLTLTNTAEVPLADISFTITGDFELINACPTTLAAHSTCDLGVTFTPTELGTRTGTLTVHDNWAGSTTDPRTVKLTGTGTT
jgi:hypothetical protein